MDLEKELEMPAKQGISRRSFLNVGTALLIAAGAYSCGGGGGGGGGDDDPDPPVTDTIAPGKIDDLTAAASAQYGERVTLEFTQPGDDNYLGMPKKLIIKVSKDAITSENLWNNAYTVAQLTGADVKNGGANRTLEYDLSQISDLVANGLNSGALYFSVRAVDEAGNMSPLSNSPNQTIPSKAEFYVDKWLSSNGFNSDYNESKLVIRGDISKGINANADALAQILINSDDQNGNPYTNWATWQNLRDILLQVTDGILIANNSELMDTPIATQQSTSAMGYALNLDVINPLTSVKEQRVFPFLNMTQSEWDQVHNIQRNALVGIVSAFPENYGGTLGGSPDPNHNPEW